MNRFQEIGQLPGHDNEKKIRILILNLYTEMGGGENALYNTLRTIDRKSFNPIMVFPKNGTFTRKTERIGIETVVLPYPVVMLKRLLSPSVMLQMVSASRRIHRLVREKQVDAVQCSDVLSLLLLALPVMISRIPVVYSVIFFHEWTRMLLFNLLALMLVDIIVTNSHPVADDLCRKTMMLDDKIRTVVPGVDTMAFRPLVDGDINTIKKELGINPSVPLIGMVGRFDPVKGHIIFLRTAALLLQSRPDARFVIVGGLMNADILPGVDAYHHRVLQESRSLSLGESLSFLPDREDLVELLRGIDILVCPSENEGFGLVVLEALASGVPVVVSRSVGAWDVVKNLTGVFTIAKPEPSLFAGAIVTAMGEKKQWHEEVRGLLSRDYNWNVTSQGFESIYRSLQKKEVLSYH
jgi:glycosyltransferase involved in cell wall biosynthesis